MARRYTVLLLLLLAVICAAACATSTPPSPQICDGISAEVGGCDVSRPSFEATDCEGIAAEFGRQLEGQIGAVISGPESTLESKATRSGNAVVLTAQLAKRHVDLVGLVGECDAEAFMRAAEDEFTAAFKAEIGDYLYDGSAVDYADWRAFVVNELGVLGGPAGG